MQRNPGVEQAVRRAGIEAGDSTALGQNGDVRYTAQIGNDPILAVAAKNLIMKHGKQRRALAARCDIAPAEIRHHRDSGHLGERIGIADLPSKGHIQVRSVAQRLSMTADGRHAVRADPCTLHQRQRRPSKGPPEFRIDLSHLIKRDAVSLIDERRDSALEFRFKRCGAGRDDAKRRDIEIDQRRIDSVHAGSGNQTEVNRHCAVYFN